MMMMEDERQERNSFNVNDIDLSLLRLTSPPYDYSLSSIFSAVSNDISPLKRSSPESDESDFPKRRKISPLNPILIPSPPLFTYPETQSPSILDQIRDPIFVAGQSKAAPVSENQERTPSPSKTPDTETMKIVNNRVEEINCEETNYAYEKQREEEEDCGEGMRIERSGDGFVIRLKCKCRQAFRVLFSDHHLYFKPL